MSIDEAYSKIMDIAVRRAGATKGFCAVKMMEWDARIKMYARLLKAEYNELPDDQKERWLNEQERAL